MGNLAVPPNNVYFHLFLKAAYKIGAGLKMYHQPKIVKMRVFNKITGQLR